MDTATASLLQQELSAVILLGVAAAIAILVSRIRIPFTVALVLVGLGLAFFPDFIALDISSDLILGLLVPPLLFEAVFHLPWQRLSKDILPVMLFALAGTLLGAFFVAWVVYTWVGLPWLGALVFGALISATDPVAVIALFKSLGVSKRLSILVEGESLFNDAVAVVLFTLAMSAAVDGTALSWGYGLEEFLIIGGGGLSVGIVLGYIVAALILRAVDNPLIETTTTLALAYGSYVVAESFGTIFGVPGLHFSGILAVVAAGLMVGNLGLHNTSPSTRLTLENFWELLAFLVNSFIFLFIGIKIHIFELDTSLSAIGIAIAAVLGARLGVVYALSLLHRIIQPDQRIPFSFQHVAFWSGLRGAISLALALIVANSGAFSPQVSDTIKFMTFGVVLFTLLFQGTTVGALIRKLGLSSKSTSESDQQRQQAIIYAHQAGRRELEKMGHEGVLFQEMAIAMTDTYEQAIESTSNSLGRHFASHPELEVAMMIAARRDALLAEQSALLDLGRRGLTAPEIAHHLIVDIDNRLAALKLLEERWEVEA